MKRAFLLLSALLGVSAHAQPIYRCVDSVGKVAYGAFACPRMGDPGTARPPAGELALGRPSNMWVASGTPVERKHEADHEQLRQQDQRALARLKADMLRVRRLQEPLDTRKAAVYADNNRRCQMALRAALLCGSGPAVFVCDEKGFRKAPASATQPPRVTTLRPGDRRDVEQCTLQATRGR